jgi:hypothetical protein
VNINPYALIAILIVIIATAAHAAARAWRKTGRDVESMIAVVKPCPDCTPEPHEPAECICALACGSPNCTGDLDRAFQAWEASYQASKGRRLRRAGR